MPRMPLNSLENSRMTLTRLMRLRRNGEIDAGLFRDMVYSFSVLLNYWKVEKDSKIEERLDSIEQVMKERK